MPAVCEVIKRQKMVGNEQVSVKRTMGAIERREERRQGLMMTPRGCRLLAATGDDGDGDGDDDGGDGDEGEQRPAS